MDYKISYICSNYHISKTTIYNKINYLKSLPNCNDYLYYTGRKLFITQKGLDYIISDNNISNTNVDNKNSNKNDNNMLIAFQNQIIESYKDRIKFLEEENQRLLNIISIKEQKELAKDVKKLNTGNNSLFKKITSFFKG